MKMTTRFGLGAIAALAAVALSAGPALALDCTNPNKPPAECGSNCTEGPIIQGNWAWLPSVFPGAPEAWVFVPPGTVQGVGIAGEKGNYQNGEGYALLVNAICDSQGQVLVHRQTENGIQLLEGCSGEH